MFTSRRYQRQVKSTTVSRSTESGARSVDPSETRKEGRKFQAKKFEDYFY